MAKLGVAKSVAAKLRAAKSVAAKLRAAKSGGKTGGGKIGWAKQVVANGGRGLG